MSNNLNEHTRGMKMKYHLTHKDAIAPSKTHESDCGYDLNLVKLIKKKGKVKYYTTGVKVELPEHENPNMHYNLGLYARSSLVATGHQLANGVGKIDTKYRGEIIAALIKFDPDAPNIILPAKLVQIVPYVSIHFEIERNDKLTKTKRGEGGFGSTNKK